MDSPRFSVQSDADKSLELEEQCNQITIWRDIMYGEYDGLAQFLSHNIYPLRDKLISEADFDEQLESNLSAALEHYSKAEVLKLAREMRNLEALDDRKRWELHMGVGLNFSEYEVKNRAYSSVPATLTDSFTRH